MRNRPTRAVGKLNQMAKQLQYKRLLALALLLAAAFAGLGYRLVDLQVFHHEELRKEAQNLTHYTYRLEPRRGDILDARGNLMATSVFVKTVCANPALIGGHSVEVAHALAPLLQTNEDFLARQLAPRTRQNASGETMPVDYALLKRDVPPEVWNKIRDTMATLSFGVDEKSLKGTNRLFYQNLHTNAIYTESVDDQVRNYPNQDLAAHVLGYVRNVVRTNDGAAFEELAGMDGIERYLNDKLKGVRGWRVTERDGHKREIMSLRSEDVEPHDGLNVVLTIDSVIQHIVETALTEGMEKHSPVSISCIVVRPHTGEILAMASLPDFDPNSPEKASNDVRRNRMISEVAEPGSTFKIVVVSGALNEKIVKLSDEFDCEHGTFYFAGKALHDHEAYGILSVENIITKSSNIGAAKIGIEMGETNLHQYILNYGFGKRTGIPLPSESPGIVHDLTNWTKLSISRIPMGHEVCVTPLQMTMAMSAIANGGVLMRPMLVDRLVDQDGSTVVRYSPQQVRRVVGEDADREIIEALKTVITADGTAVGAALDHYTVAGKTGTAQKSDGYRYLENKYFSSFIGFFPADNPEICIYVALDDPKGTHFGGQVAAPVFKQIAEKAANYLNIRPDKDVEQTPADMRAEFNSGPMDKAIVARAP